MIIPPSLYYISLENLTGENVILKLFATLLIVAILGLPIADVSLGQTQKFHPDGTLHRIGGFIGAGYVSYWADEGVYARDREFYRFGLKYPVVKYMTLQTGYGLERSDSISHHYSLMVRIYPVNPLRYAERINPDGPLGVPFMSFEVGGKIADVGGKHFLRGGVSAGLPIVSWITVGVGWKYFEEENPGTVEEFSGRINIHTGSYEPGEEYLNPDAADGRPSFYIESGGSSRGLFARLIIAMPISQELTFNFLFQGELEDSPRTKAGIMGLTIDYYPRTM